MKVRAQRNVPAARRRRMQTTFSSSGCRGAVRRSTPVANDTDAPDVAARWGPPTFQGKPDRRSGPRVEQHIRLPWSSAPTTQQPMVTGEQFYPVPFF
jgi:hypothetical protein